MTALMVALVLMSAAHAQISPELAQKAPDAATISATAEQRGYVRVIVEFAGPVQADQMRPDPAFLASVKAQIAATQDAIIAAHFGSASHPTPGQGFPRAVMRFDIIPGFALNVTRSELEALAADPRVLRIQEDRLSTPSSPQ